MSEALYTIVEMECLAKKIAKIISIGDAVALIGDLGSGKTTLASMIIHHATGDTEVTSPTYQLIRTYKSPRINIIHADLYRIRSTNEITQLGILEMLDESAAIIEWPEIIIDFLPHPLKIWIAIHDENSRKITVSLDKKWCKLK